MIIKAKPLPVPLLKLFALPLLWFQRRRFNKMVLDDFNFKPGHSYLLMFNHFGFLDGFFAYYLCLKLLDKKQKINRIYTMSVKKQMEKHWWLKYSGSFSVEPGKRSIDESLDFAAEVLNQPGNVLLYYPQGNLESLYVRSIEFKDGIYEIATRTRGNCQLVWCSVLTEYFESTKPSAYLNLLDCGLSSSFNFENLKDKVNRFHRQAIKKNTRFTNEPKDL